MDEVIQYLNISINIRIELKELKREISHSKNRSSKNMKGVRDFKDKAFYRCWNNA